MITDMLRSCYKTKMRLWRGENTETEVRWFFAPEGARVFPGPHPFGSHYTWHRKDGSPIPDIGERGYLGYDLGGNNLGYGGLDSCGSDAAKRNGGDRTVDPVIATDADGWAVCCGDKPVICDGRVYPERFRLYVASAPDCPCLIGESWLLHLYRTGQPVQGVGGPPWWGTQRDWWVNGWYAPVTPQTARWGDCEINVGGAGMSPIYVIWSVVLTGSCQLGLGLKTFGRHPVTGQLLPHWDWNADYLDPVWPGPSVTWTWEKGNFAAGCNFGPPFPVAPFVFTVVPEPD